MSGSGTRLEVPAPRANPELLGHEVAERTLLRAAGSGRLPHAWLIGGARGIGKATLAYRFARFLLSGAAAESDLFGAPPASLAVSPESALFQRVAANAHADLRSLELGVDEKSGRPRSEIVVRDVRAVGGFLHMTAGEGGWRVVIVDPVDALNQSAANALLKVLEEPPAQAVLLLVSHAPGALLPTIRSRCCHLPLAPLPEATVAALLTRHAPGLSEPDRAALARLAEGSIGRALELAACGGLELYRELAALLADLPRLDMARAHRLGERLAQGSDPAVFRTGMELLIWLLARLIRARAEGRPAPPAAAGEGALPADLLERRSLAQWLAVWEKIAHLAARAEAVSLDRKQVVLAAFLELEAFAA